MKQQWLSLDERIELTLGHLIRALDRRPIAKGNPFEGLPYTLASMGRHLVMMHAYPELMETPGRYLAALTLCLQSNPNFKCDGISAVKAAERLSAYITGKINRRGKFVTTKAELAAISRPEQIFTDPVSPNGKAESAKAGWYGKAGIEYNGHLSILMEGLIRWYLRSRDKTAKAAIDRAIKGRISDPKSPAIRAGKGMVLPGMMTPIALYYEATGDKAARKYLDELAADFVRNVHLKYFPDGMHSHGDGVGHLHCRMGAIAGFARYAKLAGRPDYMAAAENLFAANIIWGTEFGYMPERHVYATRGASDTGHIYQPWVLPDGKKVDFSWFTRPRQGWDTCEICVTADAIDCAILLAQNGYEKYWDIAERFINHLYQTQITDTSFLLERNKRHPAEILGATFENVRESVTGGFYSATSPTWAMLRQNYGKPFPGGREGVREGIYYGIYCACCPGWAARTLGRLKETTVTEKGNRVDVNFPFDCATKNVQVKSRLPFEGRIDVKALKPVNLMVRIPDWVEHSRVEVRVGGKQRNNVEFKNTFSDYVRIGHLKAGERAVVLYPLRREKKRHYIEYHPSLYEADWLGNYVMGMQEIGIAKPEGENTFDGIGRLYEFKNKKDVNNA